MRPDFQVRLALTVDRAHARTHPESRDLITRLLDVIASLTATIRRTLITVPARIASSARRLVLHLPTAWPWEAAWTDLFNRVNDPPAPATA